MNEVIETLSDALGELRCESEDRKYSVQTEELKKAEKKLKRKNKEYQKWCLDLLENDRLFLEDYLDAVGHVHYQEEQRAYYQGLVDGIQILAGLGLIPKNENVKKLIEKIIK